MSTTRMADLADYDPARHRAQRGLPNGARLALTERRGAPSPWTLRITPAPGSASLVYSAATEEEAVRLWAAALERPDLAVTWARDMALLHRTRGHGASCACPGCEAAWTHRPERCLRAAAGLVCQQCSANR